MNGNILTNAIPIARKAVTAYLKRAPNSKNNLPKLPILPPSAAKRGVSLHHALKTCNVLTAVAPILAKPNVISAAPNLNDANVARKAAPNIAKVLISFSMT